MLEIALGVVTFTVVILTLTAIILLARKWLLPAGAVTAVLNDELEIEIVRGSKLLIGLSEAGILLPSACGGKGTCGQCRVQVLTGGGPLLPTERALISRREARDHQRLACQVRVQDDLAIQLPDDIFGAQAFQCRVLSSRYLTPLIKELVLEIPGERTLDFRAGSYVQVECPSYHLKFRDIPMDPGYRGEWDRLNLWHYESRVKKATRRAYSLANPPAESNVAILNVRIAIPPPGASSKVPPGAVSSYLFSLSPGDPVRILGPFGDFFALDTDREMVFIAGGAGMAPMRSHILDQLQQAGSRRQISFWYGARSRRDLFYNREFDRLAQEHDNFRWQVALSEPLDSDGWKGQTGLIHQVVYDSYLKHHPCPEDVEFYLCGPPVMCAAVMTMLDDLGVADDQILLDDFGN